MNQWLRARAIPALSILWFFIAGLLLIPRPGLQNDELFFSGPLYYPDSAFYSLELGATKIPFMLMSYSGAFKTWLYAALFAFFAPNEWSVRVPVLLMGMVTVYLTWTWVRRIAGDRAAAIAAILLSTDTIFLMTDTFDWGPVAMQHILLMGGLVAIQRWLDSDSRRWLALGFFLWGLGIWDKALLSWPLIGMTVACLCVFPREFFRRLRLAALAIAIASFLIGAAPLVWYNIARPGETAKTNTKFNASELGPKLSALRMTADGTTLFGYMVYKKPAPSPRAPATALEKASVWIAGHTGDHRTNLMLPGYLLALLCLAAVWKTKLWRAAIFLLIVMAVEWLQMALNQGTGGASHHVILIWPFPLAFAGIVFAEASRRIPKYGPPAIAVLVAVLTLGNILNTNEYLAEFIVNGGFGGWTDAIYPLAASVEKGRASWIGIIDWGYLYQLRMLHEGDLPLFLPPIPPEGSQAEFAAAIQDPSRIFIRHTADKQMFPGVNERFHNAAAALGYTDYVEKVISDRNGRPVFEIFRFRH